LEKVTVTTLFTLSGFYPSIKPDETLTQFSLQPEGAKPNTTCDNLTEVEMKFIQAYTKEEKKFYKLLNSILLKRKITEKYAPELIFYLLQAVSKCRTLPGKVYRGIDNRVLVGNHNYDVGSRVIWITFSSCSRSKEVALNHNQSNTKTLFTIEHQSGRDIAAYSLYPKEKETILVPNTVFEVVSATSDDKMDYIKLKEVPRTDLKKIMVVRNKIQETQTRSSIDDDPYPEGFV
jgi:hypothetical protein